MNAIDARKIALRNGTLLIDRQIQDISLRIDEAVKHRHLNLSYNKEIEKETKQHFENLGFRVEYKQCGMNEFETVISW